MIIRSGLDQNGQALIQVLVAAAVLGVMIISSMSMMYAQTRQLTGLREKMAELDVSRTVTATLADGTVCTQMLTNPKFTFDPLTVGTSDPPTSSFSQIPVSATGGAPALIRADSKSQASPMAQSLSVSTIKLQDIQCIPAKCTPTTNQFTGNLVVEFDFSKLIMSLAPLSFPVRFNTSGPANKQTITNCLQATATSSPAVMQYQVGQQYCTGGTASMTCIKAYNSGGRYFDRFGTLGMPLLNMGSLSPNTLNGQKILSIANSPWGVHVEIQGSLTKDFFTYVYLPGDVNPLSSASANFVVQNGSSSWIWISIPGVLTHPSAGQYSGLVMFK